MGVSLRQMVVLRVSSGVSLRLVGVSLRQAMFPLRLMVFIRVYWCSSDTGGCFFETDGVPF